MKNRWQNLLGAAGILALASLEAHAQTLKGELGDVAAQNDSPTVVWGAAETATGGEDIDVVRQKTDAPNPLGSPIIDEDGPVEPVEPIVPVGESQNSMPASVGEGAAPIVESNPQGVLKPWEEPLPQPSDQIESEIYQSGNDIIDEQAYPIKDVSTVTEPNLQPIIVTQ